MDLDYMLLVGAVGAFLLLMIMIQLFRLNWQLKGITKKLKGYLDDVCSEPSHDLDLCDVSLTKEEKDILLSSNVEDEQIFNEVLQEIFQ